MSFKELGPLKEVEAPPDRKDPFADKAANRLEQDLHMVRNGIRGKRLMGRIARYKKYMTHPSAQEMYIVRKYKDAVIEVEQTARSVALQPAPPSGKKSSASRAMSRRAKRSRYAVGHSRPGDAE